MTAQDVAQTFGSGVEFSTAGSTSSSAIHDCKLPGNVLNKGILSLLVALVEGKSLWGNAVFRGGLRKPAVGDRFAPGNKKKSHLTD